jgi:hypothetical protein
MNKLIAARYPDCGDHPDACFERYVREHIAAMQKHKVSHVSIGQFDDSYEQVFKIIYNDLNKEDHPRFWWNVKSANVGTVKDKFVYSMDLFVNVD